MEEDEESFEYSNAVDMWSLGCVVYKILTSRVPFPDHLSLKKFCEGKTTFPEEQLSAKLSAVGIEFIKSLLLPKASERLTAETALKAPWLEVSHEKLDSAKQRLSAAEFRIEADFDLSEALSRAASNGHEVVMQVLFQEGANIAAKGDDRLTAFQQATRSGHAAVKLLLEKEVDPDFKDENGRTPLSWAAESGHEVMVKLLLEKGVKPTRRTKMLGRRSLVPHRAGKRP